MKFKGIALIAALSLLVVSLAGCANGDSEGGAPEAPAGYKTYSKYGFSVQYADYLLIYELGMMENEANDTSGLVSGERGEEEGFFVGWTASIYDPGFEDASDLDDFYSGMEMEGTTNIVRGDLVETTKAGHGVIYETFSCTAEGEAIKGVYGVWYCDNSQRLYQLGAMHHQQTPLEEFQRYLDSLVCH